MLKVTVQVDSAVSQSGTVVGDFTIISVTNLYIGALPRHNVTSMNARASRLPLHPTNSFRGCLQQVERNLIARIEPDLYFSPVKNQKSQNVSYPICVWRHVGSDRIGISKRPLTTEN